MYSLHGPAVPSNFAHVHVQLLHLSLDPQAMTLSRPSSHGVDQFVAALLILSILVEDVNVVFFYDLIFHAFLFKLD